MTPRNSISAGFLSWKTVKQYVKLARVDLPAEAYTPPLSEKTVTGSYVAVGLSENL